MDTIHQLKQRKEKLVRMVAVELIKIGPKRNGHLSSLVNSQLPHEPEEWKCEH